jgi:hypothetical protein
LILIAKDTDFLREARYASGHDGILWVTPSRTELHDTVTAALTLTSQYPSLANMRFTVHVGGQVSRLMLRQYASCSTLKEAQACSARRMRVR